MGNTLFYRHLSPDVRIRFCLWRPVRNPIVRTPRREDTIPGHSPSPSVAKIIHTSTFTHRLLKLLHSSNPPGILHTFVENLLQMHLFTFLHNQHRLRYGEADLSGRRLATNQQISNTSNLKIEIPQIKIGIHAESTRVSRRGKLMLVKLLTSMKPLRTA